MSFRQFLEEGTASRVNHFLGLDALILTGQGDIGEVGVSSEISKGHLYKALEIIPLQAKLLVCHNLKLYYFLVYDFKREQLS